MVIPKSDDGVTIPLTDKERELYQYSALSFSNFEIEFATSFFDYRDSACTTEYTYTIDDTSTASTYGVTNG